MAGWIDDVAAGDIPGRRIRGGLRHCARLDVSMEHRGKAGVVSVRYRNLEQLDEVVRRLGRH
jgi:hypothetical protein